MISERAARRILLAAMVEERCAEVLDALFFGASATVDSDGRLVLLSADILMQMVDDAFPPPKHAADGGHDNPA